MADKRKPEEPFDKKPSLYDEDMAVEGSYNKARDKEPNDDRRFKEEMAAEAAVDRRAINDEGRRERRDGRAGEGAEGTGIGWLALALSIISLFFLPLILGAAGIIVGMIARRQGAGALGGWAIGIGVAAIIIMLFAAPFL